MKQTAVEWLVDELTDNGIDLYLAYEIIEQAKKMEKQQIMEAVEWGNRKGYDEHRLTCILDEDEDYYNETYKKPLK
jgi:hypothetical protein